MSVSGNVDGQSMYHKSLLPKIAVLLKAEGRWSCTDDDISPQLMRLRVRGAGPVPWCRFRVSFSFD